jgi:hypothetical protein
MAADAKGPKAVKPHTICVSGKTVRILGCQASARVRPVNAGRSSISAGVLGGIWIEKPSTKSYAHRVEGGDPILAALTDGGYPGEARQGMAFGPRAHERDRGVVLASFSIQKRGGFYA